MGGDLKGKMSPLLYIAGIVLAFVSPWLSMGLYVLVAIMWLVPIGASRRIIGRE